MICQVCSTRSGFEICCGAKMVGIYQQVPFRWTAFGISRCRGWLIDAVWRMGVMVIFGITANGKFRDRTSAKLESGKA